MDGSSTAAALASPRQLAPAVALAAPSRTASWFTVLMWGLAFHSTVIAFLFGTLGVPAIAARSIAAWKEAAVILLGFAVIFRMITHRGPRTSLQPVDLVVASFLALNLGMLAWGEVWFVEQPRPIPMRLYGLRESAFFLVLYLVGRSTPDLASDDRVVRRLVKLGVVLSVLAILETLFVSAGVFALLGVPRYFQDFLGMESMSEGSLYGLPHFYFTQVGGYTVQRAGSAFLGSQALALSFLLILPAATVRVFGEQRRPSFGTWMMYLLLWAGLFSTITRMTTVTVIVSITVMLILLRRFDVLALFIGTALVAMIAAIVAIPGFAQFVWDTLTWQTLSSDSHTRDWIRAYYTIAGNPLGAGLGTADITPLRFGYETLAGDNLLLKYGVELGIPGLLAFAGILIGIAFSSFTVFRRSTVKSHRELGLLTLATTIGILINGLTAVILSLPFLAYLYFWLAGTVVTLRERSTAGT
jgi:hypothetical protein